MNLAAHLEGNNMVSFCSYLHPKGGAFNETPSSISVYFNYFLSKVMSTGNHSK